MNQIQLRVDDTSVTPEDAAAVQAGVAAALQRLSAPSTAEVAILLTSDEVLRELNGAFRQRDEPTDVLSFPAEPEDQVPGGPPYLGDIVISVPRAAANASDAGLGRREELVLLAVHGLLHLLGHEDETVAAAADMYRLEIELGVRRPEDVPPEVRPLL